MFLRNYQKWDLHSNYVNECVNLDVETKAYDTSFVIKRFQENKETYKSRGCSTHMAPLLTKKNNCVHIFVQL